MRTHVRAAGVMASALGLSLAALPALAQPAAAAANNHARGAVFVQTNRLTGNTVVGYSRLRDGSLVASGEWATGGLGGLEVAAPLDALASQGSLVRDAAHHLLIAVNAGSDTITVFRQDKATLVRLQVLPSGGEFPVGITTNATSAYVLNAGGAGAVTEFALGADGLTPTGISRGLGLANTTTPTFITAPGQIGSTPDGAHLVVTTKAANTILVFATAADGTIAQTPVATPSAAPVPFSFTFDRRDNLIVTAAGNSSVTSYAVGADGALAVRSGPLPDGQNALCWDVASRHYVFGANAGSNTITSWKTGPHGDLRTVEPVAAQTAAGPIDLAVTGDDDYLYVLDAIAGSVEGFGIAADGSLTLAATVTGLPAFSATDGGPEGIVAT